MEFDILFVLSSEETWDMGSLKQDCFSNSPASNIPQFEASVAFLFLFPKLNVWKGNSVLCFSSSVAA